MSPVDGFTLAPDTLESFRGTTELGPEERSAPNGSEVTGMGRSRADKASVAAAMRDQGSWRRCPTWWRRRSPSDPVSRSKRLLRDVKHRHVGVALAEGEIDQPRRSAAVDDGGVLGDAGRVDELERALRMSWNNPTSSFASEGSVTANHACGGSPPISPSGNLLHPSMSG
jgi:hypothetical protein